MKNLLFLSVLMSLALYTNAQNRSISDTNNETPDFVQDYVHKNFSSQRIDKVNKNRARDGKEYYDVNLNNGAKLRFDNKDSIVRIQGDDIPQNALPPNVYDYAHENYRNQKIVSWEKKDNQQILSLDNNTNLTFDSNGMYMENRKNMNDRKDYKKDHKNNRENDPKN